MNPPLCRHCGKSEWRHRCIGQVPVPAAASKTKPKPKKKRIRRKYQRELMRKRRAAEKQTTG
jgi:hypothetical protein